MRKTLISTLLLLFLATVSTKGQDTQLHSCLDAQLTELIDRYDQLDLLIADAEAIETTDDLLVYSEAQINWRDNLQPLMPPCAEALEFALLMFEWSGDEVVTRAIKLARERDAMGSFELDADNDLQRIRNLANVIRRGDEFPALLPMDDEQGKCPIDDADSDFDPIRGFQVLLEALTRVDSVDLLNYYGFSHLAFSDELWQQLPACSGKLHIILQLMQLLSDLSAMVAIEYAGISPYANPYEALVLEGAEKLDEMVPGEVNHYQARLLSPRRSNLPRCSKAELATLDDMRREFDALIDSAPSFADQVSYLPYVEAYLLWRNENWPHPSPCAETFEIAVIMRQIASNYVSGPAYSKAQRRVGLTLQAKPQWIQLFSRSNLPELLTKRLSQATGYMNDPKLILPRKNNLPTCTDAQLRQHLDDLLGASSALVDLLFISGTVGDLIEYFPAQLQWRETIWLNLPPCEPIFEIAWRLSQLTDDFGALLAFHLAGMQAEAQRYEQQIRRDMELLAEIIPAWQPLEIPRAAPPLESELPSYRDRTLPGSTV